MMGHLRAAALLAGLCCLVTAFAADRTPATFLANEGQWLPTILYKGRSATANVSFLHNGISFSQVAPEDEEEEHEEPHVDHHAEPEFQVWNMTFAGIDARMRIVGELGRASVYSYLPGNDPSKWVVHPMEYERIVYHGIYPGIDLHFRGEGLDLEYDHVLHPGADIAHIRTVYSGIEGLALNATGDLVITTAMGTQIQRAPVSWQMIDGLRRSVRIDFVLQNDSTFGFIARDGYNKDHDLVIDPLFEMVWASYTRALGGSNNINYCFANAMDTQGNVYLTGYVDGTFPTTPGSYSGPGNVYPDIFVAKFSSDGTTLLYSTYLPANSSEFGTGIAVDDLGRAYVTGVVDLNFTGVTTFPSTPNAYQPVHDDGSDAFLTVLDPTGSSLVYSTFLGGVGSETGYSVALGPTGIAYITGTTSYIGYPIVNATSYPTGDKDIFIAKFDIAQAGAASLLYSARIGGGAFNYCTAHGVAVDAAGNAYITGSIGGTGTNVFPVTPGAYNTVYNTGQDGNAAYLLKVGTTLPATIAYCTYLGPGIGTSVAVNTTSGEAFVSGTTYTVAFPITPGALQAAHGGATDAFALRMNTTGSALIYSTFLGGSGYDESTDIVVNGANEAYIAGIARDDFPTSPGALQPTLTGGLYQDLWVVQLNSTATAYGCGGSTYVGGTSDEYYGSFYDFLAPSLALHHNGGQDTLSVAATSHSLDFPTTPGVYEPTKVNGIADQPIFFKMTCESLPQAPTAGFNASILPTCTGALVDFDDTSTNGADSWTWSFPGGTPATSTAQNPQDIAYALPGNYTVTLIACNAIGCDTIVQQITITLLPAATVDLGNDTTLCDGSTGTLTADPGFTTYVWTWNGSPLPDNTSSIAVGEPGIYTVSVADSSGCSGADTVQVAVLNTPAAAFSYDLEEEPCALPIMNFSADAVGTTYVWSFGDSTFASGGQQQHTYAAPGTYNVLLTVSEGPCSSSTSQSVIVPEATALGLGPAVVPNVFSPNGDGLNDCFAPIGLEDFANCYALVVFDRWGVPVFRSGSPNACWKGTTDAGDPLPDGVYFYLLTLSDEEYPGYVEILR